MNYDIIKQLSPYTFIGKHKITDEVVFIKRAKGGEECLLKNEATILLYLQNNTGFVKLKYYGRDTLITTLLDNTIAGLRGIAPASVQNIALQLMERIEILHSVKLLHRDIKPDNIMLKGDMVYLIDFGFAKSYVAAATTTATHIPYRENVAPIGTMNFASTNVLKGVEYSRRDDLESIFYTLVYLLANDATWRAIIADLYGRDAIICRIGLPTPFMEFYRRVRLLAFSETPDYNELKTIFTV